MIEGGVCDVNQLDADVLLPPRKRLLAGFMRQGPDDDDAPRPSVTSSRGVDFHLHNLLASNWNNPDLTPQEIAEASRSAAIAAARAAKAARATAEEKAAVAAKAVAAAKGALDLIASFPDEASVQDRYLRKNKMKKRVPVELLYSKQQHKENNGVDEELARELRWTVNSSGRMSEPSSSCERKGYEHKIPSGYKGLRESPNLMSNGLTIPEKVGFEGSDREVGTNRVTLTPAGGKVGHLELDEAKAESKGRKSKASEDMSKC